MFIFNGKFAFSLSVYHFNIKQMYNLYVRKLNTLYVSTVWYTLPKLCYNMLYVHLLSPTKNNFEWYLSKASFISVSIIINRVILFRESLHKACFNVCHISMLPCWNLNLIFCLFRVDVWQFIITIHYAWTNYGSVKM